MVRDEEELGLEYGNCGAEAGERSRVLRSAFYLPTRFDGKAFAQAPISRSQRALQCGLGASAHGLRARKVGNRASGGWRIEGWGRQRYRRDEEADKGDDVHVA